MVRLLDIGLTVAAIFAGLSGGKSESASKLDALQTLRDILCREVFAA